MPARKRIVIMGAAGRDFHVFNTVFRDDPGSEVVGFTAAQIPGIDERRYPAVLSGDRYPTGIPIVAEADLDSLISTERVDEVVFAYSDLPHVEVMHRASRVLAAGPDFRLVGPDASMLRSSKPVIAVCATRTGAGKSQTGRVVARCLRAHGLQVAWVRHPMPYGDLESMVVQRFATPQDLDDAQLTIEEREEYERPVAEGFVVWAGVDYEQILRRAEAESDVILWDGGNNDFSFYLPDLLLTVTDAARGGQELTYHPGEVNLRLADIVVINKIDPSNAQTAADIERTVRELRSVELPIVRAGSDVSLEPGPSIESSRVLVVEDGPSLTHGGLASGAGLAAAVAARAAEIVDPRPFAVGSIADLYWTFGHLGPVLPAMGYSDSQLAELQATIDAVDCDVVIAGTPIDLGRLLHTRHPVRRVTYELHELDDSPTLDALLAPYADRWRSRRHGTTEP